MDWNEVSIHTASILLWNQQRRCGKGLHVLASSWQKFISGDDRPTNQDQPGLFLPLAKGESMNRLKLGQKLIGAAAILTIAVPIAVDGLLFAKAHMANPLWLPHAKLHCAMSFFAAISLGMSALIVLKMHPLLDRANAFLAAFLATAFWIGLVLAGVLPGTSYGFVDDPNLVNIRPPIILGMSIEVNVAIALCTILIGWIGFMLIVQANHSGDRVSNSA